MVYLKKSMCILLTTIYTKRPKISDGSMSETSAAGGSNLKESVPATAIETLPVVGDYDSSSSDTLVVMKMDLQNNINSSSRTGIIQDWKRP